MSTYRLRRLTRPDILRRITSSFLNRLLECFREDLESLGLELPQNGGSVDLEHLAEILSSESVRSFGRLAEALYYIDEMSTASNAERLFEDICANWPDEDLGEKPTPADIAVVAWCRDSRLMQRRHAERTIHRRRSFRHFASRRGASFARVEVKSSELEKTRAGLSDWFQKKQYGQVSQIFCTKHGDVDWYMIRYGGMHQLVPATKKGQSTSVLYQPELYDLVGHDSSTGEIRVNTQHILATTEYQSKFGELLHGDPNAFAENVRYSLEPLRIAGDRSLACRDVDEMKSVTLTEVQICVSHAEKHYEILKASDLFAALKSRNRRLPRRLPIVEAAFVVQFEDSPNRRTVRIRTPNNAQYTRDDDSIAVERWLRLRGFKSVEPRPGDMIGFWEAFRSLPSLIAARIEWEWRLGEHYECATQFLYPSESMAAAYIDANGIEYRLVEHNERDVVAISNELGTEHRIDPGAALVYEFNWQAFAGAVAIAMGVEFGPVEPNDAQTCIRIGTYRPYTGLSTPVFLIHSGDSTVVHQALDFILARHSGHVIAVLPIDVSMSSESDGLIAGRKLTIMPLEATLQIGDGAQFSLSDGAREQLDKIGQHLISDTRAQQDFEFFPTPAGARWKEVSIRFLDPERVSISCRDATLRTNHSGMGMKDGRTGSPSASWRLLHNFAQARGLGSQRQVPAANASRIAKHRLARDLQRFFRIEGDPFTQDGGWRPRFEIQVDD